jgi:hypothetical protein
MTTAADQFQTALEAHRAMQARHAFEVATTAASELPALEERHLIERAESLALGRRLAAAFK